MHGCMPRSRARAGEAPGRCQIQPDGNLVLIHPLASSSGPDWVPYWASDSYRPLTGTTYKLIIQVC